MEETPLQLHFSANNAARYAYRVPSRSATIFISRSIGFHYSERVTTRGKKAVSHGSRSFFLVIKLRVAASGFN